MSEPTNSLTKALISLRPLIHEAKLKVNAIPLSETLNSFSGQVEQVRIATAEMLQRIIVDVFGLKLVVDTQVAGIASDKITVCASVYILTETGYVKYRSSHASELRSAGNFSPLLSAESRAIRLVLRSIGLRSEGEIFPGETADQIKDASESSSPHAEVSEKAPTRQEKQHNDKTEAPEKGQNVYFGINLDKRAMDYVGNLIQVLRLAKSEQPRNVSMRDFIKAVAGPDSPKRLEGCSVSVLENLFKHYVTERDCKI